MKNKLLILQAALYQIRLNIVVKWIPKVYKNFESIQSVFDFEIVNLWYLPS